MMYRKRCNAKPGSHSCILSKQVAMLLCLFFLTVTCLAQEITASMQKIKMHFTLDKNGVPVYSVYFDQKPVIEPSEMGFVFSDDDNFKNNFQITGSEKKSSG